MKKGNRIFVSFTAVALLMQCFSCTPAFAAQSTVGTQVTVSAETTAEEVYVYGLSKDNKEEKKAAKEQEKADKKAGKEEEKAAKKNRKKEIKQEKELYKYEKKVQKKKVKEKSVKDSAVEWNIQMVNAEETSKKAERKIKLALIDSGVDYTDDIDVKLRKNFVLGHEEVSILYEDISGHGTSVAGILAAKDNGEGITGINPNLELYSAKVLDEARMAPVSRVVEAIYWAIENDVDIINISFGTTTDSEELYEAIRAAYDAGILIVAAAGNSGVVEYPAAYGEVIAVGSVDNMGNRSEGSAVGEALELVAPGELVLSTGAFYGVAVFSGTSMAAPHVAGIASLLWEKDPDCSADFIRFLLASTANLYGSPEEYGNGMVDYEAALSQYEALKDAYEELEVSGIATADYVELADASPVEYNDSEIAVFEDLDYVEGSWNKAYHADIFTGKGMEDFQRLTAADLAIVKLGAIAPDEYIRDMRVHPEWHGFTSYQLGVNNGEGFSNYVSSYIYLTEIASAIFHGTDPKKVTPDIEISSKSVDIIRMVFRDNNKGIVKYNVNDNNGYTTIAKELTWNQVMGNALNNKRNRAMFVYGMAIHTMSDMFAHSIKIDGKYFSHADNCDAGKPDNPSTIICPSRYYCNIVMLKSAIDHMIKMEPASLQDYCDMASNSAYDGSFKLNRLLLFIEEIDSGYYSKNKTVLKRIGTY